MNLMSSNNSFYRYKIDSVNDIDDTTYTRRLTKAFQNNKNSFFFEISATLLHSSFLSDFIKSKIRPNDLIAIDSKTYSLASFDIPIEQYIFIIRSASEANIFSKLNINISSILLMPLTRKNLNELIQFQKIHTINYSIFWSFTPYDDKLRNSLTVKDIKRGQAKYNTINGLEIFNTKIPQHYELEPESNISYKINWEFNLQKSTTKISIIIPTYNNIQFLCNVTAHLINQNYDKRKYEIIIVDDGSQDQSSEIVRQLFLSYEQQINLKFIYWNKVHPIRGEQMFFRPGIARNLGARISNSEFLVFLDSDIIVPDNFIETCILELTNNNLIQFQRFHINQEVSKSNPQYKNIILSKDTYIEDKNYWSGLFFSNSWSELPDYWKYTCTYALGISKEKFYRLGLFKKYYISYGFEDTDLGFEAYKIGLNFNLVKVALLHLTSYDQMQYKNSFTRRFKLLQKTAELFYLQHLTPDIYDVLGNYFRQQKSIKSYIRDLLSKH